KALEELEHARKINPRDENTLGRIAACLDLQHKNEEFQKIIREVEAFDPRPAVFYYQLGEQFQDRRHFDVAEKYFKHSRELSPRLPWPVNSLGLLYMRLGREQEAFT